MSTGLYEELGISSTASQDEIRKAYKKRALQTHPDRLPQGATAADKAESDEAFRKVNNAYEVLSDPSKRKEYDMHGVWPPPEEEDYSSRMPSGSYQRDYRSHYPPRSQTFPDPFYSHRRHPFSAYEFTDPFTLFNSIFEGTPFQTRFRSSHHSYTPPMNPMGPFDRVHRMQEEIESFMNNMDRDPFSSFGSMGFGGFPGPLASMMQMQALPSPQSSNGHGRWVSESIVSSTVNGVTQTVLKRIDSNGNEHITRTLPDGREVRTINGIEQRGGEYLPQIDQPKSRRSNNTSGHRYLSPAPVHPQPVATPMRADYAHVPPPPPLYTSNSADYRNAPPPTDRHRRSRRSSDKYAYVPNTVVDEPPLYEDKQARRWWHH